MRGFCSVGLAGSWKIGRPESLDPGAGELRAGSMNPARARSRT